MCLQASVRMHMYGARGALGYDAVTGVCDTRAACCMLRRERAVLADGTYVAVDRRATKKRRMFWWCFVECFLVK